MSAYAIVAALFARLRTGEGQELHTSLASQSVLLQIGELTSYRGAPQPPTGAQDCIGVRALERYYECADGWIAIACTTPKHYHALVAALDLAQQDADDAFDEEPDGTLATSISAALRQQRRDDALSKLHDAGAPAAPVLTVDETYTDGFLEANGYYESYVDPTFGAALGVAMCARFERTNTGFERPAPTVGQHTDEVLRDFGLSPSRIDALVESGASWRGSAHS
jgi:crotonobetainyl-CoA:carnitine CoA-transferase CaiB-like acyl-CoA transferase